MPPTCHPQRSVLLCLQSSTIWKVGKNHRLNPQHELWRNSPLSGATGKSHSWVPGKEGTRLHEALVCVWQSVTQVPSAPEHVTVPSLRREHRGWWHRGIVWGPRHWLWPRLVGPQSPSSAPPGKLSTSARLPCPGTSSSDRASHSSNCQKSLGSQHGRDCALQTVLFQMFRSCDFPYSLKLTASPLAGRAAHGRIIYWGIHLFCSPYLPVPLSRCCLTFVLYPHGRLMI